MSEVHERRAVVRRLVKRNRIPTQQKLTELLKREGLTATQATVSRDIAALRLVKMDGCYALPEHIGQRQDLSELLRSKIHRVRKAGNHLIVLQTNPGEAGSLGIALDRADWPSVAGTVAGDDTVFVACDARKDQLDILRRLKEISPEVME